MRALALAVAIVLATPPRARAEAADPDRAQLDGAYAGIGAGAALVIIPASIGGALEATSDDIDRKRAGIYLLTGGMMLAPIVSHLLAREWTRAALFGALPMASFISVVTLLQLQPEIFSEGEFQTRVAYGVMLCISAITSTVGVIDSLNAPNRIRARRRSWAITPGLVPRGGAVFLGGTF